MLAAGGEIWKLYFYTGPMLSEGRLAQGHGWDGGFRAESKGRKDQAGREKMRHFVPKEQNKVKELKKETLKEKDNLN